MHYLIRLCLLIHFMVYTISTAISTTPFQSTGKTGGRKCLSDDISDWISKITIKNSNRDRIILTSPLNKLQLQLNNEKLLITKIDCPIKIPSKYFITPTLPSFRVTFLWLKDGHYIQLQNHDTPYNLRYNVNEVNGTLEITFSGTYPLNNETRKSIYNYLSGSYQCVALFSFPDSHVSSVTIDEEGGDIKLPLNFTSSLIGPSLPFSIIDIGEIFYDAKSSPKSILNDSFGNISNNNQDVQKLELSNGSRHFVHCLHKFNAYNLDLKDYEISALHLHPKINWYKDDQLISESDIFHFNRNIKISRFKSEFGDETPALKSYIAVTVVKKLEESTGSDDNPSIIDNFSNHTESQNNIYYWGEILVITQMKPLKHNYKCQLTWNSVSYTNQEFVIDVNYNFDNTSLDDKTPFFILKPEDTVYHIPSIDEPIPLNHVNNHDYQATHSFPFNQTFYYKTLNPFLKYLPTSTDFKGDTGINFVEMICIFGGTPTPTVSWLKNGLQISLVQLNATFIDNSISRQEEALKVLDSSSSPSSIETPYFTFNSHVPASASVSSTLLVSILYVRSDKIYNSGMYTCRISNSQDSIDASAYLKIITEPRLVLRPAHMNRIEESNDLTLSCLAVGNPRPRIIWYKDGRPLTFYRSFQNQSATHSTDYVRVDDRFNAKYLSRYFAQTLKNPENGKIPVTTNSLVNLIKSYSTLSRLYILGTVNSDKGIYQCLVDSNKPRGSYDSALSIVQPYDQDQLYGHGTISALLQPSSKVFGWTFTYVSQKNSSTHCTGKLAQKVNIQPFAKYDGPRPKLGAHLSLNQNADRAISLGWKVSGLFSNEEYSSLDQFLPLESNERNLVWRQLERDIRISLIYGPTNSERRRTIELKNPKLAEDEEEATRNVTRELTFGGQIWVTRLIPGTEYFFELRAQYNTYINQIGAHSQIDLSKRGMTKDVIVVSTQIAQSKDSRTSRDGQYIGDHTTVDSLQQQQNPKILSHSPSITTATPSIEEGGMCDIKAWATSSTSIKITWNCKRKSGLYDPSLVLYTVYLKKMGSALVYFYYLSRRRSKALLDNLKFTNNQNSNPTGFRNRRANNMNNTLVVDNYISNNPSRNMLDFDGPTKYRRNVKKDVKSMDTSIDRNAFFQMLGNGGDNNNNNNVYEEGDYFNSIFASSSSNKDTLSSFSSDFYHFQDHMLEDEEEEEEMINVRGIANWYHAINLKPFTYYSIRVAMHDLQTSKMYLTPNQNSSPLIVRTFSDVPGTPPINVTVRAIAATKISVSWLAPILSTLNGVLTGYKIRYKISHLKHNEFYHSPLGQGNAPSINMDLHHKYSTSERGVHTTDATKHSIIINELRPFTQYSVRVSAITINGSGVPSDWIDVRTYKFDLQETSVPEQPAFLKLNPLAGGTGIEVEWARPDSHQEDDTFETNDQSMSFALNGDNHVSSAIMVRGYTLGYGIGVPDIFSRVFPPHVTRYALTDLQPGSEYVVSLRAFNNRGNGRERLETVKTLPKYAPTKNHWNSHHQGGNSLQNHLWLPADGSKRVGHEFHYEDDTSAGNIRSMLPPIGLKATTLSENSIELTWEGIDKSLPYFTENLLHLSSSSSSPPQQHRYQDLRRTPSLNYKHSHSDIMTRVIYTLRYKISEPRHNSHHFLMQDRRPPQAHKDRNNRKNFDYFNHNPDHYNKYSDQGAGKMDLGDVNFYLDQQNDEPGQQLWQHNYGNEDVEPWNSAQTSSSTDKSKHLGGYSYLNVSDVNKATVSGLKPNTQYEFAVKLTILGGSKDATVNTKYMLDYMEMILIGKSTWSLDAFNTTFEAAPGTAPRDLTIFGLDVEPNQPRGKNEKGYKNRKSCCAVFVNWQPPKIPNGKITGYLIYYTTQANRPDREWVVESIRGNQLTTLVKDLTPNTPYHFKIQARNMRGFGPTSPVVYFKTPKIIFPPPSSKETAPSSVLKSGAPNIIQSSKQNAFSKNSRGSRIKDGKENELGTTTNKWNYRTLYLISAIVAGCLIAFLLVGLTLLFLVHRKRRIKINKRRARTNDAVAHSLGQKQLPHHVGPGCLEDSGDHNELVKLFGTSNLGNTHHPTSFGGQQNRYVSSRETHLIGVEGDGPDQISHISVPTDSETTNNKNDNKQLFNRINNKTSNHFMTHRTPSYVGQHTTFKPSPSLTSSSPAARRLQNHQTRKGDISNSRKNRPPFGLSGSGWSSSKLTTNSSPKPAFESMGKRMPHNSYNDPRRVMGGCEELGDDELSSIYQQGNNNDDDYANHYNNQNHTSKLSIGTALKSFNGTTSGYGSLKIHHRNHLRKGFSVTKTGAKTEVGARSPNVRALLARREMNVGDIRNKCSEAYWGETGKLGDINSHHFFQTNNPEPEDDDMLDSISVEMDYNKRHHENMLFRTKSNLHRPPSLLFFRTNSKGCLFDQLDSLTPKEPSFTFLHTQNGGCDGNVVQEDKDGHVANSTNKSSEKCAITHLNNCTPSTSVQADPPQSSCTKRTTGHVFSRQTADLSPATCQCRLPDNFPFLPPVSNQKQQQHLGSAPQSHSDYASGTESCSLKGKLNDSRVIIPPYPVSASTTTPNTVFNCSNNLHDCYCHCDYENVMINDVQSSTQDSFSSPRTQFSDMRRHECHVMSHSKECPKLHNSEYNEGFNSERNFMNFQSKHAVQCNRKCCDCNNSGQENNRYPFPNDNEKDRIPYFKFPHRPHYHCQCNSGFKSEDGNSISANGGTTMNTTDNDAESSVMLMPPYLPPPPSLLTPLMLQHKGKSDLNCTEMQHNLHPLQNIQIPGPPPNL